MSKTFRVGEYLVEADLNRISGPDTDEQIEPRSMEVLVYLAEHAGEVVAKEQLIRAVWKDTFVADGALWQGISRLREVFRDDPKAPSYIQTVPRRGYVLIADVRPQSEAPRYQVLKKLGQGAMGEVFLAEDSLLHRRVALKFILKEKQADESYRKRLLKEARAAAALDHPYVCKTYTVGQLEGRDFIALEYIQGQTLEEKLEAGPLSLDDALGLAIEMSEALAEAHEQGIIHRDFKPGNVMVTDQGHTKIMDFGLARRIPLLDKEADLAQTVSSLAVSNMSPGTLAYMSPEQLRGEPLDQRSDLFSFGMVLYEMISGRHAFAKTGAMETASAILSEDPPSLLDSAGGQAEDLRALLSKLLAKELGDRSASAAPVAGELRRIKDLPESPSSPVAPKQSEATAKESEKALGVSHWWIAATVFLGIALAGVLGLSWFWTDEPTPSQYELVIENGINQHHFRSSIALSPDGRRVVFKSGPGPLYVRNLDDRGEAPLRDSEGGNSPFFSPDGEWVAFFADRKLKKVSISGGSAEILCDLFGNVLGGTWGPDQTIVIADSNTLWQVPASGGTRQRLSMLEEDGREDSHWNPSFLPDGSGVLFTVFSEPAASRLAILDLGSGEHRELLNNVTRAIYVSTGHLVYTRGDGLYGIPFDLGTHSITGSEVPLVQDILVTPANVGQFGVSVGTLAYVPGRWSLSELVRVGLDGQLLESLPLRPGLFSK